MFKDNTFPIEDTYLPLASRSKREGDESAQKQSGVETLSFGPTAGTSTESRLLETLRKNNTGRGLNLVRDSAVQETGETIRFRSEKYRLDEGHGYGEAGRNSVEIRERDRLLDSRESQLNARIAQFEALVRNTKRSLQEKMDDLQERELKVVDAEELLRTQQMTFEESARVERSHLDKERVEQRARISEIEERFHRREQELQDLDVRRTEEMTRCLEQYRNELEGQLREQVEEYHRRFVKKCEENQLHVELHLREEEEKLRRRETELLNEHDVLCESLERRYKERVRDLEERFAMHLEESKQKQLQERKEQETNFERRLKIAESDLTTRREELENRISRQEQQLGQRERLLVEAEEEWNQRRDELEMEWSESTRFQKEKLTQLSEFQAKLEERERYLSEVEGRLQEKETQMRTREDSLLLREKQVQHEGEKYRDLKMIEAEIIESQKESIRIREGLVRERHQQQKAIEAERLRMKESVNLALKRVDEEREELASQNRKMEQMRATLERSREELGRMHRETLEVRLATEELWFRLAGDSPSEDLKVSLNKIRQRLADEYRGAVGKIERQKEDLKGIRDQMLAQHEKLLRRREELNHWVQESEASLLEKEQHLRQRELDMDRRQSVLDEVYRKGGNRG